MQKIKDISILEPLLAEDEIAHLNLLGTVKLIDDYDLFVDDSDNPRGYLLQKREWNIFYAEDYQAEEVLLSELLTEPRRFAGILKQCYDAVASRAEIDWQEICYLYYLNPDNYRYQPPEHQVDYLTLEDAEEVDSHYTYSSQNPDSLKYIKMCISNFPTAVVRDEQGNPLSWSLVRDDGSLGIAYTKKEHRRQGLAISVNRELIKRAIEFGLKPYVHIVTDNLPSQGLAEDLGFQRYGRVVWFATR